MATSSFMPLLAKTGSRIDDWLIFWTLIRRNGFTLMMLKGIFVAKVGNVYDLWLKKPEHHPKRKQMVAEKCVICNYWCYACKSCHASCIGSIEEKWKVSVWWYRWVPCSSLLDGPYHKWMQIAGSFVRSTC